MKFRNNYLKFISNPLVKKKFVKLTAKQYEIDSSHQSIWRKNRGCNLQRKLLLKAVYLVNHIEKCVDVDFTKFLQKRSSVYLFSLKKMRQIDDIDLTRMKKWVVNFTEFFQKASCTSDFQFTLCVWLKLISRKKILLKLFYVCLYKIFKFSFIAEIAYKNRSTSIKIILNEAHIKFRFSFCLDIFINFSTHSYLQII